MLLRFLTAAKANHFTFFKDRLAVANQRRIHGLLDHVVTQLDVGSALWRAEQVQVVFAIG